MNFYWKGIKKIIKNRGNFFLKSGAIKGKPSRLYVLDREDHPSRCSDDGDQDSMGRH
jgi:hypothetical protein